MNRFISVAVTNDNGQPVNKTVAFKASDVVQVIDLTTFRQIVLWDTVTQKEVTYQSSTTLANILTQGGNITLVSFVCNATSPNYAGLTVLLNPLRVFNVTGTSTTILEYHVNMGTNGLVESIILTSNTSASTTISGLQAAFNGTAAPAWGSITGTLSNQTDLQTALNAKFNTPSSTSNTYVRGDGFIALDPIRSFVTYIDTAELKTNLTTGIMLVSSGDIGGYVHKVLSVFLVPGGGSAYTGGAAVSVIYDNPSAHEILTIPAAAFTNASAGTKVVNAQAANATGAQVLDQIYGSSSILLKSASNFSTGTISYYAYITVLVGV